MTRLTIAISTLLTLSTVPAFAGAPVPFPAAAGLGPIGLLGAVVGVGAIAYWRRSK